MFLTLKQIKQTISSAGEAERRNALDFDFDCSSNWNCG